MQKKGTMRLHQAIWSLGRILVFARSTQKMWPDLAFWEKASSELPFKSSYVWPPLILSGICPAWRPIRRLFWYFFLAENTEEVAINSGERRSGREPLLFASSGRGRRLRRTRDTAGACCGLASGGLLFGGCMVEVRKITKGGRKEGRPGCTRRKAVCCTIYVG